MASLGHVLVGLAIARAHDVGVEAPRPQQTRVASAVAFSALALLPDLDVIGFKLGIAYSDVAGHRGASHSLFVAIVGGVLLALPLSRMLRARFAPTALAVVLALASHGLLDMLTDGGLGAAVLWPLDDNRYFFPVQPLPVAPIGLNVISLRGLYCFVVEAAVFSPFLFYAIVGAARRRS